MYTDDEDFQEDYSEDLEFLSEAQDIANYEDELAEFKDNYVHDEEFRNQLWRKYKAAIFDEEYDECYGVYVWDDYLWMNRDYNKCLENLFNAIRSEKYRQRMMSDDNPLPF